MVEEMQTEHSEFGSNKGTLGTRYSHEAGSLALNNSGEAEKELRKHLGAQHLV